MKHDIVELWLEKESEVEAACSYLKQENIPFEKVSNFKDTPKGKQYGLIGENRSIKIGVISLDSNPTPSEVHYDSNGLTLMGMGELVKFLRYVRLPVGRIEFKELDMLEFFVKTDDPSVLYQKTGESAYIEAKTQKRHCCYGAKVNRVKNVEFAYEMEE